MRGDVQKKTKPGEVQRRADPLVGRKPERRAIIESLSRDRHVLVSGPAGIGKTFLVGDVARHAERRTERLMPGPATASMPLAALAPIGGPDDIEPGNLPAIVSWYLRHWSDTRRHGRTLLWIDDLQHLDAVSGTVIRHAIAADLVDVIATLRTPEPVVSEVESWFTEGWFDHVTLGPLATEACRTLVRQHSPETLTPQRIEEIVELGAGHPLFVRDLARIAGADDPHLHVDDVVGRRLGSLSPAQRSTARAIALAEPVDRRVLDSSTLDELVGAGIVCCNGAGRVSLDHPLYTSWLLDEIGGAATEVYANLVEAAEASPDAVDAIELARWHQAAGRGLHPDLAGSALQLAFSRADGETARQLAQSIGGEVGRLRMGQATVLVGEVDQGLAQLADMCDADDPDVAVEAAMWASRHAGLTMQRFDIAHGLLDRAEQRCLTDSQRRLLLIGRLWLWMFATGVDSARFDEIRRLADGEALADRVTYELAYCGAGLVYQVRGPAAAAPLLERTVAIEQAARGDESDVLPLDDRCRAAAIIGWGQAFAGHCGTGVEIMNAALEQAIAERHDGGIALLSGTAGLFASVSGQVRRALRMTQTLDLVTGPDWFGNARLALLTTAAAQCYAGKTDIDGSILVPSPADMIDLEPALLARPIALLEQRDLGSFRDATVRRAFEVLADGGKRSWLATFAAELIDLRYGRPVIAWLAAELHRSDADGIAGVAADAMEARLDADSAALVRVGDLLERAGFVPAATRVYGDATRVMDSPDATSFAARAGIVRCRRRWDGAAMWWLNDVDGLPTPHQVEISGRVIAASTREVAAELVVSKRTIENHLYRTCALLGVSGQEELASVLEPRARCADTFFGRTVE